MKKILRLALAQIDSVVGDLRGNAERILNGVRRATEMHADVVAFPELALTGYPPEDLLLKPQFVDANLTALQDLAQQVQGVTAIVGFVDRTSDIHNAAAVLAGGRIVSTYHKMFLPNYGVFDEFRYFRAGRECPVVKIGDATVGVSICEDIWYPGGPTAEQAYAGAEVIMPAADQFWGERTCKVRDPFGHEWCFAHVLKIMTQSELDAALKQLEDPASVAARRGLSLEEVAPKVLLKAQEAAKAGA